MLTKLMILRQGNLPIIKGKGKIYAMDKAEIAKQINNVSPSFCLAKWLQVTIDLVNGTTHSCHHPKRHDIPIEGLEENPSQLHNTPFKKEQRKLMIEGVRPPECEYCWKIEDTPGDHYSDRLIKSSDDWAWPHLKRVKKLEWDQNINPTYLEVMFDNTCNLSCSYCLAPISSSIYSEMKKFGPYPVKSKEHRMYQGQLKKYPQNENPYIKAFWKWLPELENDLEVLRITGGEPLLSSETETLLEKIDQGNFKKLSLSFNSNLIIPDQIIDKFIMKVKSLLENKRIKSFDLFASVDSSGKQAEYIRRGLDYQKFVSNIKKFAKELQEARVIIMGTYGVMSITGFRKLLQEIYEIKKDTGNVILDLSYLKDPDYLRANLVGEDLIEFVKEDLHWMKQHQSEKGDGFSSHEVNKLSRILNWMISSYTDEENVTLRGDFFSFVNEYDKRYGSSFVETFPEMKDFYVEAKKSKFLSKFGVEQS